MKLSKKSLGILTVALTLSLTTLVGCGGKDSAQNTSGKPATQQSEKTSLQGTITVDGSSTVFPITEAVGEEFRKMNSDVKVTVGLSGTGGGFKKFIAKEIDINDASRPIKDSEKKAAEASKVGYKEVAVAYDGLSIVVNPKNTFVNHLTVDELNKIWNKDSKVKTWKDVRAEWPNEPIKLYGPGADSGTFDYFTEEINGETGNIRADYTASEAGDEYSLGFFGYAYYVENKDKIKVVPVDGGKGPITPSPETIENGTYAPLSRPLFLYVSDESLTRPEVKEFLSFYLKEGKEVIPDVGYIKLPQAKYDEALTTLGIK
jgi:phosphate transport system substrate-binding protein